MLRYSATSARAKSLSLASGCVNVCVFYFSHTQNISVSNFSKCKMQIKPVKIGEIGRDFVKVENFLRDDVVLWQMLFYASLKSLFSLQICHM